MNMLVILISAIGSGWGPQGGVEAAEVEAFEKANRECAPYVAELASEWSSTRLSCIQGYCRMQVEAEFNCSTLTEDKNRQGFKDFKGPSKSELQS